MSRSDRADDAAGIDIAEKFETYEDYLDSQLTGHDMNYLEDEEMARQLVELGYRGLGDTIRREDFEARKKMLLERSTQKHIVPRKLASLDKDLTGSVFLQVRVLAVVLSRRLPRLYRSMVMVLSMVHASANADIGVNDTIQALAEREELLRSGKLTTILFIRDYNNKGHEISGYIDLAYRMRTEDFVPIFEKRKRLLPKPSDLSYYNWETQLSTSNSTPLYQVIADSTQGLLFKNKRDRKIVNVNPESDPGDNTTRIATTLIIFYIVERVMPSHAMNDFCNCFLPMTIFFFLSSFGWTIMLALRFYSSHNSKDAKNAVQQPPIPFRWVWATPLVFTLSMVIVIWAAGDVTQSPILFTIVINLYIYACGLAALSNAPHSVVARQMRKAGGYLAVLILVWVPNLVYNLISIGDTSSKEYGSLLDLATLLYSSQGFLNVLVYILSNNKMRIWLRRHCLSTLFTWRKNEEDRASASIRAHGEQGRGSGQGNNQENAQLEDQYSDEEDEAWLQTSQSFSDHIIDIETLNNMTAKLSSKDGVEVTNPLRKPPAPLQSPTRSILIARSDTMRSSAHRTVASSQELDHERTITHTISITASTPRTSAFTVSEEQIDEGNELDGELSALSCGFLSIPSNNAWDEIENKHIAPNKPAEQIIESETSVFLLPSFGVLIFELIHQCVGGAGKFHGIPPLACSAGLEVTSLT
eukprot:scaffold601_cov170-Ochromonas_danica.AAC.60